MAPAKNPKPPDYNPWGWSSDVQPEDVQTMHIYKAYRIIGYQECKETKRNCKRNPYCIWGLGEKKWKEDNEGEDEDDAVAFRCEGEYAGLQNLGATCYVNSLLQLWFHNPIFRPAILKWKPSLNVDESIVYKPKCPLAQLQAIFARLKISKRSKIDPSDFVSSLLLNTGEQQDAQEFAKLFMDYIVKLLSDYGDDQIKKLIAQSANGQLQYETECLGCKNKTRSPEAFTELNLSVKKNLSESLDELLADEIISDEYMCSNCHKKNTAKRRMQLLTLPPILNLQLLRFVYDREAQRRKKVTQNISFPEVLDLQQKVHHENPDAVEPAKFKYNLTAVLIHDGQSASSGHYVAQIKDLRSNEWLKFNDEFVKPVNKQKKENPKDEDSDDSEKKSKLKKSKNSPSLTSSGAYMLVYTSEECVNHREPDPDLHKYLIELVHREDASFEKEVNKNKSEKDFELAVKIQRRKEVEWLYQHSSSTSSNGNGKSDSDSENIEEPRNKIARLDLDNGSVMMDTNDRTTSTVFIDNSSAAADTGPCDSSTNCYKTNGISSEISTLPVRNPSYTVDEVDFISVDWISQWLDAVNPVPPIENSMLMCEHNKLAPPQPNSNPCLYKIIPSPLATVWYEHYTGGPRLRKDDLCEICVQVQCRKLRAVAELDEDSKQVSELVKKCDAELAVFSKAGKSIPDSALVNKCWITKENLRNWKRIAKQNIEGPPESDTDKNNENGSHDICDDIPAEDDIFNRDLLCEHSYLSPDITSRKMIPKEAWDIIQKHFKDPFTLEVSGSVICNECKDQEHANSVHAQQVKELAARQKTALSDLYNNRNRPDLDKLGDSFIVSTDFMTDWRRFVKDPMRHEVVTHINNRSLLCKHEKFMYPIKFASEFLNSDEEIEEMVYLLTPAEWELIQDNFTCDQEIRVTVVKLGSPDGVNYEPDICKECVEEWLESAMKKQFEYEDSPLYIIKREKGETIESDEEEQQSRKQEDKVMVVTGKREVKPHNPLGWMEGCSSVVRRSARPRNSKSEKTYKVKSSMTIKELKSKICADFKALLSDQHLFYENNELTDITRTLQECRIPAKAKIYLEIDTAENGSVEEPVTSVETGFLGTLLHGGSGLGDSRSPVQNI